MATMTTPTVKVTGSVIAVTHSTGRTNYYNRDRLVTAYLALLDEADRPTPNVGRRVVDRLEREYQFDHRDAMAYTLTAVMLNRHNIEP